MKKLPNQKHVEVGVGKFLLQHPGYFESSQQVEVLGLDLSLNSSGWAYLGKGNLAFGLISPKDFKLGRISMEMRVVLDTFNPTLISVEDMVRQAQRYTSMDVGCGTGAALSQVEEYILVKGGVPILRQTPDRLKYFVRRQKDTDKTHLQEYVKKLLIECSEDPESLLPKAQRPRGDICDAVTLAVSGMVAFGVYKGIIPRSSVHEYYYEGSQNYLSQIKEQYANSSNDSAV